MFWYCQVPPSVNHYVIGLIHFDGATFGLMAVLTLLSAAKYGAPTITSTPKEITFKSDGTLECRAGGGYPVGQIRWFDGEGKEKRADAPMLATPMDGGLFQLSSRLVLQKGSISSEYNCTVFNASGRREGEATYQPEPKTDGTSRFRLLGSVLLLSTTTSFSCCCSLSYGGCKSVTFHKPVFVGRKP